MAVHSMSAGHSDSAVEWLEKAIAEEQTAEALLSDILELEKTLIALAKKHLRDATKAK